MTDCLVMTSYAHRALGEVGVAGEGLLELAVIASSPISLIMCLAHTYLA